MAKRVRRIIFNNTLEVLVVVVKRRRVIPTVLRASQQLNVGENLVSRVRGYQICSPHETSIVLLVGIVVLVHGSRTRRLVYEIVVRGDEQLYARARGQAVGEVLLAILFAHKNNPITICDEATVKLDVVHEVVNHNLFFVWRGAVD